MTWALLALDLLRRFWKPIAAGLAGIALYLRGRHDADAKADDAQLRAQLDIASAGLEVEAEQRRGGPDAARERLRQAAADRELVRRAGPRDPDGK